MLLGLPTLESLEGHPKLGASWEGFALEQVLAFTGDRDAFFWATPSGAELDLLVFHGGKRYGFEMKYADAPRVTKSMHAAIETLALQRLFVVHPGPASFPLQAGVEALALRDIPSPLGVDAR